MGVEGAAIGTLFSMLLVASILVAFIGTTIGASLVKKITLQWIQQLVGSLLIVYGLGLIFGLI